MLLDQNIDAAEAVAENIRSSGGSAHAMQIDVADVDAVEAAAQRVQADYGARRHS